MDLTQLIQSAAAKYSLDPSLLRAVIMQESGGDPAAVSAKGAQGLMQLMPATASSLGVSDPLDPGQNVDAGARYLSGLLNQYGGDTSLALAAYNAGPGAVATYGGIPPYAETQNYVSTILARLGQAAPAAADSSLLPVPSTVAPSGLTGGAWVALAAAALAVAFVAVSS